MRGLISLAVIFFVALSAQASARTYIECVPRKTTFLPSGKEIKRGPTFSVSFDVGEGLTIKNMSWKDCPISSTKTDEFSIVINCGPFPRHKITEQTLGVNRVSGEYFLRRMFSSSKDGVKALVSSGNCRKIKPKF